MKCLNCGKDLPIKAKKYCNNKCQAEFQYHQWVLRWKAGLETGITGQYQISHHLKRYLKEKFDNKCSKCGWSQLNPYTNEVPLEVEHIDGNYLNNSEENLDLLCPNCHSLTSTYKGANRGNGRKARKKIYSLISGISVAWYRVCFGSRRSEVQILYSGPY